MNTTVLIIIGVIVLLVLWFIAVANKLAKKKLTVENAFADIDVFLTKRFDLIPNLVNTVKGYAKHEKDTLEQVISARNKGLSANTINDKIDADNELTSVVSRLIAISESYPELKADQSFIKLQETLETIENDLVGARRYYNAVVKAYNTVIVVIPDFIVAKILGYKAMKMYEAREEQRENVKVDFE